MEETGRGRGSEGGREKERVGGERQANNGITTLNYVYLFCV